ncbi:MAG TPA: GNAT family N-acetyltransferase [Gaiellaceae bacterium]|jgi:ribosomal protein S18 acetylase RimI-like enzyme|nr:GNAT family N-acetyltransferase [Gaiellaceae bacterium]
MSDELERIFAFAAAGDMGGERTVPSRFGTAVYSPRVPLRSDANHLRVERRVPDADSLVEELRQLEQRMAWFPDGDAGERLAPALQRLGWRVDRHVVMAQRRPPQRAADTALVQEVEERALRPARRRLLADEPWARPEVVEQLFRGKELIAERVTMRCFAAVVDGEIASYTDLYLRDDAAQIEDLGTLPQHRGRGYASAVMLKAIEEARSAGADLVFLFAERDGWPKELYRRLGFDELGHYVKFFEPST